MTQTRPIRVAVIGAGFFGSRHAQQFSTITDAQLVAIVDHNEGTAREQAAAFGCRAESDYKKIMGDVDAVSIVTPTAAHCSLAAEFLELGVSVLVEKPICTTVEEARYLVRLARERSGILQVGHVERYNPVWSVFETHPIRPMFIETNRCSAFPFRSLDVSVVLDVMIHDIDLVLAAAAAPVVSVESFGVKQVSPSVDRAIAYLNFANGCRAQLSASRVHHRSERTMRIWSDDDGMDLDFLSRTATVYRKRRAFSDTVPMSVSEQTERERMLAEMFDVETRTFDKTIQPLRNELEDFVRSVREHRTPKVSGEAGLDALAVARMIEQRIETQQVRKAA